MNSVIVLGVLISAFVVGIIIFSLFSLNRIKDLSSSLVKTINEESRKNREELIHTLKELSDSNEKRIGESFKMVSERLEAVQQGLGEMRSLAKGVGDLKRVLMNVKTRGIWGEIQLGAILENILTPDQYAKNVQIGEDKQYVVEYAIKIPGADGGKENVWLPIDSKFPQEDYIRLLDAFENADSEAIQKASASLSKAIYSFAKDINQKYIRPPFTTDFAIMFLPTEGLYAEILRRPSQIEEIQTKFRVVIAGPTTLSAMLNSIRIGFQSIALQKRSNEVWAILSAVKTEFERFENVLEKLKKQTNSISNTIEKAEVRTRVMKRKLKQVETLPEKEALDLLEIEDD